MVAVASVRTGSDVKLSRRLCSLGSRVVVGARVPGGRERDGQEHDLSVFVTQSRYRYGVLVDLGGVTRTDLPRPDTRPVVLQISKRSLKATHRLDPWCSGLTVLVYW